MIIILAAGLFLLSNYYFFKLPQGELILSTTSPSGTYIVNIYLVKGSMTTDDSIRGEVVIVDKGKTRNIYWAYHERTANVEWIDDNHVIINGRKLNVLKDMYDWRK